MYACVSTSSMLEYVSVCLGTSLYLCVVLRTVRLSVINLSTNYLSAFSEVCNGKLTNTHTQPYTDEDVMFEYSYKHTLIILLQKLSS